jgi:hypothetical protein
MTPMAALMRSPWILALASLLVMGASAQTPQRTYRDGTPLDDGRIPKNDGPARTGAAASPQSPGKTKTGIVARGVSRPKESKPSKAAKAKTPIQPLPIVPEPTPEQPVILRPAHMPAVAPRISYEGGQLTIVASNSTMADIFAGIRGVTGVKIEVPSGPGGDRVAAKIGPAPLRSVLLSLLQGSRYDYVILGSVQDPEKVERVILTPKLGGGTQPTAAAAAAPLLREPEPDPELMESADPEPGSIGGPEENEGFAPVPQPAQPQSPSDQPQGQPQPANTPNPNGTPKTPEQLLEDLKRLEQERQQQQQNQRDPRGDRPR